MHICRVVHWTIERAIVSRPAICDRPDCGGREGSLFRSSSQFLFTMLHTQCQTLNIQHRRFLRSFPGSLSLQQPRPLAFQAASQVALPTPCQQAPRRSLVVAAAKGATANKGFGARKQKVLKDGCPCGSNLYYKVSMTRTNPWS
jgi:hypothetical protein